MNTKLNVNMKPLMFNVMLAVALMANQSLVYAACTDNGDGTFLCSGTSDNIDNPTPLTSVTLDNTSGVTTLNNATFNFETIAAQSSILNTTSSVGFSFAINTVGTSDVVINNTGGVINVDGSGRVFNPAGWTTDDDGRLLNDGMLVGIAAGINATSGLALLTINNNIFNDGIFHEAFGATNVPGMITNNVMFSNEILTSANLTAAVNTNAQTLNVNGDALYSSIYSYGGASYTPPTILDGTQVATINSAGITNINLTGFGTIIDLHVVDRNPLLSQVQAENPNLAIAFNTQDVGPRNSVINVQDASILALHLGSGAHLVNLSPAGSVSNIFVDQRDAEVVEVVGGVANTLYKVHGDRTFTLNSANQRGPENVTINGVVGAVNTLNYTAVNGTTFGNVTANGLGNNTLNLTCVATALAGAGCGYSGVYTGLTNINLMGNSDVAATIGDFTATDNITLSGNMRYGFLGQLTAQNVVIGNGIELFAPTSFSAAVPQTMGSITGNLINNGNINVGEATLNVDGTAMMNAGTRLTVQVTETVNGALNATGGTTFNASSQLKVNTKPNAYVVDGSSYTIATNITGLPIILNELGFLQWKVNNINNNLVVSSDSGIPDSLASRLTLGARNAADVLFTYQGSDVQTQRFLAQIQALSGENAVIAAERLRPEINDGAIRMVLGNTDKLFNIVNTRLLSNYIYTDMIDQNDALYKRQYFAAADQGTRSDDSKVSKSNPNLGIWVQGFGDRASQQSMQGADGYGLSAVGMAAGVDKVFDDLGNTKLGFAFGYARGNVTNTGQTVNNRLDSNSFMAMAYGFHATDDWFINGAVGLGRHTYETRRQLLDFSAVGSHDSVQFATNFNAGMPFSFNDDITLIPMVSFDYSHIKESGYTEDWMIRVPKLDFSGPIPVPIYINNDPQYVMVNSPTNLAIESRRFDSFRAGIGGRAIYEYQQTDWGAEIELHAMLKHEFADLAQNSTAKFAFGSPSFESPGIRPARNDLTVGGSVRLTGQDDDDQLTLLTSYDANFREKFFGQTMTLNLRYDFDQASAYIKKAKQKLRQLHNKNAPQQEIEATEKEISEIQKYIQLGINGNASSPEEIKKQKEIDSTLKTWASALSNKNLDIYFNSYAANFESTSGETRQQWERKRKSELSKATNPSIQISYLTIQTNGNKAMAIFNQNELINNSYVPIQKIIDFENKNGRWLITREDSISLLD